MSPRSRRFRSRRTSLTAAVVGAGLVVGLSACAPLTTNVVYAPSDGIRVAVGTIDVANFLVIADEAGERGRVLAALTNNGINPAGVEITLPEGSTALSEQIAPGETLNLNLPDFELIVPNLGAKPGAIVEATVTTDGESATVPVPVLDGTLPEYTDYVPAD